MRLLVKVSRQNNMAGVGHLIWPFTHLEVFVKQGKGASLAPCHFVWPKGTGQDMNPYDPWQINIGNRQYKHPIPRHNLFPKKDGQLISI